MSTDETVGCQIDEPDLLYAMRMVSIGQAPESPFGRGLSDWMKSKPVAFMEKLAGLESEYWSAKKPGVVGSWDGSGVCQACGRAGEAKITSEAALGAAREWLEKNKGE